MWPTPNTPSGGPNSKSTATHTGGKDLDGAVSLWQTPLVSDLASAGSLKSGSANSMLGRQAEQWGTPTSRDWKDGTNPSENVPTNGLLGRQAVRSLPAPETPPHGSESSPSAPASRRQLNPAFVEWLMGWPVGWTSLAPLAFDSPEMAFCPNAPPTPSAPSGDNWPTPDTQNARDGTARREEAAGKHAMSLHHAAAGWPSP